MEFYATEVTGMGPGAAAEREVWNSFKTAFRDRDGVAYYRYPVVDKSGGRFDHEPDLLFLEQDIGLMVIEVKSYKIEHIEAINGATWELSGLRQDSSSPYSQARDQAFFVKSWFDREEDLRNDSGHCKIPVNFTVALPNITREEWEAAGLHEIPSTPRIITADDLSPQSLRDQLSKEPGNVSEFGPAELSVAKRILGGAEVISGERVSIQRELETKGDFHEMISRGLKEFDTEQIAIGSEIPPGPQRIRGIAGSGKTILLAKKAAHLHAKNPDDDIVVTYFAKSLKQEIEETIEKEHRRLTGTKHDEEKLRVMHGWGGYQVDEGVYFEIARASAGTFHNAGEAASLLDGSSGPLEKLEAACSTLQPDHIPELYDAILIDEGQDFGKHFYQMCYHALREPDDGKQRLIWAYDEAQTLGDLEIPTAKEIFGEDNDGNPLVRLDGSYENGIYRSQIMRKCYRSPRQVVMLANAFGMGVQRPQGVVDAITDQDQWDSIGYEVIGDFVTTDDTVLRRPDEYSPHPLEEQEDAKPFVRFDSFADKQDEIQYVVDQIDADLSAEGLTPEDIMVIPLGIPSRAEEIGATIAEKLEALGHDTNKVWTGDRTVFEKSGEVTLTRINRAKGNEAAMVYLLNIEEVGNEVGRFKPLFTRRNEAFVGITRTRAWCQITGLESNSIADEIEGLVEEITTEQQFTFAGQNIQDEGVSAKQNQSLSAFNTD